jgi:phosphatidylinositol-3-phosphatase
MFVKLALLLLLPVISAHAERLPRPDHVVVVIEENRGYAQIMDKPDSYIQALTKRGMLMTNSHALTHPSQPNYLALFSGSLQGIDSNICPLQFSGDNLATALADKGLSFKSFAQSLPATGDTRCSSGAYMRKHNPVVNWQGTRLDAIANQTFNDFPQDFSRLPTVSFVIPDQDNDMHDGSFYTADEWLKTHIAPYIEWAFKHNSLLILTWDEDSGREDNHILTLLIGPMVKTGINDQYINHYSVLRTLLDFYDARALNASINAEPLKNIWRKH